mmetsp:Transcript_37262/g.97692  ORF Transcript_37262/g.97692 Transcript_37262/m.97692 type:complete len:409 (-) Transcript_37262:836-2062(-)
MAGAVLLLAVHKMVAVRECAALNVLSRQPDVIVFEQEGTKGEGFAHRPVRRLLLQHLCSASERPLQRRVHHDALGLRAEFRGDVVQCVSLHAGVVDLGTGDPLLHPAPKGRQRVVILTFVGLGLLKGGCHRPLHRRGLLLQPLVRDDPLANKRLAILLHHLALGLDLLVHEGLREHGLVRLVVPKASVAHNVNHHVRLEALPPLDCNVKAPRHRLDIVAVDVQNRRSDALCNVGAVWRGARRSGVGGEANLVVHHNVNRAACRVLRKLRHRKMLVHDTLPRERSVSVEKDGHHVLRWDPAVELLGPRLPCHHRVDRFEVRRVGQEGQVHKLVARQLCVGARPRGVPPDRCHLHVRRHAKMVFDISRPVVRGGGARKLLEDLLHRFLHHVVQNVEAAAVRHADHNVLDP